MYTETEGIILKQIKTVGGRRMLVLFSKRFGKISAGTSINEKGRSKSALALRPFTYGKYELNKTGEYYHINGGEVISCHYRIGEDVNKYMAASYIMEFTEKLLPEDSPAPELFLLLVDFLGMMERRSKKQNTLVIGYLIKALNYCGNAPQLDACVSCGSKEHLSGFHIKNGGVLCGRCKLDSNPNQRLIYDIEFDIVNVLRYILENPLHRLEGLALDDQDEQKLRHILKNYLAYHLDISDLKSEEFS